MLDYVKFNTPNYTMKFLRFQSSLEALHTIVSLNRTSCAVDFVCRLLHLEIISLKKPLQIGLCNKAIYEKYGKAVQYLQVPQQLC